MSMDILERARRLMAACPEAVAGKSGHAATYRVAAALVHGFGLSEGEAMGLMLEYNTRCVPAWSERELLHKVRSAARAVHDKPRGYLLDGADQGARGAVSYVPMRRKEKVKFDLGKLEAVQRKEWVCDFAWLRARSAVDPGEVMCGPFLDGLYGREERVMVFTAMRSVGDFMRWRGEWYALGKAPGQTARRLKEEQGPRGSREGCGMLIQPVDGQWHTMTGVTRLSRRTMASVVEWRYMLWESDEAPHGLWLNAVAQVRLPVVAIVTSGGRSLHALVRVDARSYDEWKRTREAAREVMTALGFDPQSLSNPTAAMRLPNTWREGKMKGGSEFEPFPGGPRRQRLLYYHPEAGHGECLGERAVVR